MASALKHSFYLVYDAEHEDNNETTMVLRLRHQSNDDASKEKSLHYCQKHLKLQTS